MRGVLRARINEDLFNNITIGVRTRRAQIPTSLINEDVCF